MAQVKQPPSNPQAKNTQHARFIEAAREAGADVESDAADRLMGKLAKTPPEPKPTKPKKTENAKG